MNELDSLLRAAGRMMLDYQSPKVFSKGHHADFVTEADIAVQSYLVDALQRAYPRAKFLAEEEDRHVLTDALTFIIDPIDGTMNFIRGLHHSSISVALAVDGAVTHAVVYNPYYDEMFSAQRGKGAWLNGQRLHVTQHAVHDSLVLFGSAIYYRETIPETLRFVEALLPNCLQHWAYQLPVPTTATYGRKAGKCQLAGKTV